MQARCSDNESSVETHTFSAAAPLKTSHRALTSATVTDAAAACDVTVNERCSLPVRMSSSMTSSPARLAGAFRRYHTTKSSSAPSDRHFVNKVKILLTTFVV